jgi:hypothetical protein
MKETDLIKDEVCKKLEEYEKTLKETKVEVRTLIVEKRITDKKAREITEESKEDK